MTNEHEISKLRRRHLFTPVRMGAFVAAGAIVLAACGGGGGGKSASGNGMGGMGGMAMPAPATTNAKGTSTPVATDAVGITDFKFSPATITVTVGSTVVWTNNDSVQHDITFDGGAIEGDV